MMTEDQIERWYEREMDKLDYRLMQGKLTQAQYNRQVKTLNEEFNALYAKRER